MCASKREWYAALVELAERHDNKGGVRDQERWMENWPHKTPEQAYYAVYPEHAAK